MKIDLKEYGISSMFELQEHNIENGDEREKNPIVAMLHRINKNMEASNQLEGKKSEKTIAKIRARLKAGKKLSSKEMNYLRRFCKVLYEEAVKIQLKRKQFEEKIESCKSKQEVMELLSFELVQVSKYEEDKEALMNTYEDVVKEFQKTSEYKSLPMKEEEDENNMDYCMYPSDSFDHEA